jgi:hypothetical protein
MLHSLPVSFLTQNKQKFRKMRFEVGFLVQILLKLTLKKNLRNVFRILLREKRNWGGGGGVITGYFA